MSDWRSKTLGEIFEISSSKRVMQSDWKTSGVPFYRAREIVKLARDGAVENDLFISEELFLEYSGKYGAPAEGDLMVSAVGTLGACYVVCANDRFYYKDASVLRFKPRHEVCPRFFQHAFRTTEVLDQVHAGSGSTVGTYTIERANLTRVRVPPLPEQRRIAAILDKVDALRTKRREALAQLDRLAQSIFVEMFGRYERDRIRWETKPLGELATDMKIGLVRSAEDFGEGFSVPYVRMNAVGRRGEFFAHLVQKTDVSEDELREYCLKPGDILFNTRNSKELVGKTTLIRKSGAGVYNNNLMRLRFDERVSTEYVAECLLTPLLQQELDFRKSGTTSVFAIYARDVHTLPIPLPPIALQKEFARRTAAIAATRELMASQCEEATRMFSSLQHRAFQGEL